MIFINHLNLVYNMSCLNEKKLEYKGGGYIGGALCSSLSTYNIWG